MAMSIGEDCIGCGGCADECPNMAIALESVEAGYVVDPALCTECVGAFPEPQCAALCPTECIAPDAALGESRERLVEKRRMLLAS
ncbi:YfhL family 4Fe-4S dicluster ferredoxin [Caenispirillum salinarum]|uniref:YfhL family 4Fe-4S dicluster ferredoxin n=1 Tax=Caenispirillum salinarum TaxID=859058 RepID=UPI003850C0F4